MSGEEKDVMRDSDRAGEGGEGESRKKKCDRLRKRGERKENRNRGCSRERELQRAERKRGWR